MPRNATKTATKRKDDMSDILAMLQPTKRHTKDATKGATNGKHEARVKQAVQWAETELNQCNEIISHKMDEFQESQVNAAVEQIKQEFEIIQLLLAATLKSQELSQVLTTQLSNTTTKTHNTNLTQLRSETTNHGATLFKKGTKEVLKELHAVHQAVNTVLDDSRFVTAATTLGGVVMQ